MISEGSCDTEDWSNDAENSARITGIHVILKYIKIENSYCKMYKYFTIVYKLLNTIFKHIIMILYACMQA